MSEVGIFDQVLLITVTLSLLFVFVHAYSKGGGK